MKISKFMVAAGACLLLASCAQTGPPLPPSLELPKAPTDLHASRKGNRVTLTWSEPTLTTDRKSVRYLGPTLVCRSQESEIGECGTPIDALTAPAAPAQAASHKTGGQKTNAPGPAPQTYADTLPANLQQDNPAAEITYAVEVLNRNARGAGLSNRARVPAVITLPPPADLAAQLTGDGVVLHWTSAGAPPAVSPNEHGIEHRYRIYRHSESSGPETPGEASSAKDAIAGEVPLGEPGPVEFTDSGFEWEKTYLYRITAVSIVERPDNEARIEIEGDDSAPVRVVAHDIFPPAVPGGLQAAYSGEGQKPFIDLIWAPVTNADLGGYNVYRSETSGASGTKTKMVKINSELVKSPAYRDFAVASGKVYSYSISAVDVRGNESQPSEAASESVP